MDALQHRPALRQEMMMVDMHIYAHAAKITGGIKLPKLVFTGNSVLITIGDDKVIN